ncbi:MAG: hypothetical protein WCH21_02275 [Bacteroidota bacterium]
MTKTELEIKTDLEIKNLKKLNKQIQKIFLKFSTDDNLSNFNFDEKTYSFVFNRIIYNTQFKDIIKLKTEFFVYTFPFDGKIILNIYK